MKRIAFVSLIATASLGAQAQMYGEAGYTAVTYKENFEGDSFKASPSAIRALVGMQLAPNFAIEGMFAFGISDSSVKVNGQSFSDIKLGLDNAYGLYIKPKANFSDKLEVFGRLGFAKVKGTAKVDGFGSETSSDSGFSFGGGLNYKISESTYLSGDYMQYVRKDSYRVNGFSFGLGFKY